MGKSWNVKNEVSLKYVNRYYRRRRESGSEAKLKEVITENFQKWKK